MLIDFKERTLSFLSLLKQERVLLFSREGSLDGLGRMISSLRRRKQNQPTTRVGSRSEHALASLGLAWLVLFLFFFSRGASLFLLLRKRVFVCFSCCHGGVFLSFLFFGRLFESTSARRRDVAWRGGTSSRLFFAAAAAATTAAAATKVTPHHLQAIVFSSPRMRVQFLKESLGACLFVCLLAFFFFFFFRKLDCLFSSG